MIFPEKYEKCEDHLTALYSYFPADSGISGDIQLRISPQSIATIMTYDECRRALWRLSWMTIAYSMNGVTTSSYVSHREHFKGNYLWPATFRIAVLLNITYSYSLCFSLYTCYIMYANDVCMHLYARFCYTLRIPLTFDSWETPRFLKFNL